MGQEADLGGERKSVELERGLFLVQYAGAQDQADPPKVVVSAAPEASRHIEVLTHPDADGATLWSPKTALVVRALQPGRLFVTVVPKRPRGSRVAEVRIEPVGQGGAVQPESINLDELRLLAHVAGIGDVDVAMNEWIAGPKAPSRIEGVSIQWPRKPAGFDVRYAVRAGAGQSPVSHMMGAGEFAGTRGRALPLTGLVFELSGEASKDFALTADAIFLSSPAMRVTGRRIVLSGPTGGEPLVGLRLTVHEADAETVQTPVAREPVSSAPREPMSRAPGNPPINAPTGSPATPVRTSGSGRVRVFRSRKQQAPS